MGPPADGARPSRRRSGWSPSATRCLTMLVGGVDGMAAGFDLAAVGEMFTRITKAHTKRMAALGLAA
ncbi:conserved hypothetical protein [Streptomyces sp. C]|nr:conserved hypothetical protein [Streptomyces sp. C]